MVNARRMGQRVRATVPPPTVLHPTVLSPYALSHAVAHCVSDDPLATLLNFPAQLSRWKSQTLLSLSGLGKFISLLCIPDLLLCLDEYMT